MATNQAHQKQVGILPNGGMMYLSELPSPRTRRWTADRKRKLVQAVSIGLLSREDALEKYALDLRELHEWRRDILRLPSALPEPQLDEISGLTIGGMEIDLVEQTVTVRGKYIHLTDQEWDLLAFMARRADLMCSRWMILEQFYGSRENWRPHKIIDVLVCRLRTKLFHETGEPDHIVTAWGRGFMLTTSEAHPALLVHRH